MAISSVLCGSFFLFSPVSNAAQNDGLVAHWSFDDCTAKDVSGNGHDGTINGNPVCVDGKKGKAFSFDGTNFIDLNNKDSFAVSIQSSPITISAYVMTKNNTDYMAVFSDNSYSGWYYFGLNSGKTTLGLRDSSWGGDTFTAESSDLADGKFHQIVGIIDDKKIILYADGIKIDEQTFSKPKLFWNGQTQGYSGVSIGGTGFKLNSTNMPEGWMFDGTIDDLRIYNRALSETEIKALYSDTPGIGGNINGVQKFSAVCKNLKTGVSKKIALADGAKPWDCTAAGLKAKKGEQVNVSITGVAK